MADDDAEDTKARDVLADCEHVDLDEDVYGAAIFSVCYDFFEMQSGKDHDGLSIKVNIFRLTFILFVCACNYALQFGLLFWVYYFVAMPGVHEAQKVYKDYHAKTYKSGVCSMKLWDAWQGVDHLCGMAFSNFWFMYAILSLWWILMLNEVRKTERFFRKFRQLESVSDANLMVVRGNEENPNLIKGLTCSTRYTLYTALLLPKIFIALVLTVVGTVWLTSSDEFSDLILNSVALEFIICIDEILFEGLVPESIKKNLENTKLVMPKAKKTGDALKDAQNFEKTITTGYKRSVSYAIIIVGGLYMFMTVGQNIPVLGVFPGYLNDAACPIWWEEHTEELCQMGVPCFPIIANKPLSGYGIGHDQPSGHAQLTARSHGHGHGHR